MQAEGGRPGPGHAAASTIAQNEHSVLKPSVVGANGSKSVAEYSFSAENGTGSVTINARTGEVVGKEVGTATIRVSTHNGVTTHLSGGERMETVCVRRWWRAPRRSGSTR